MSPSTTNTAPAGARFWDRIAERYAKTPISDEASYQRKLEITRSYFRPDMEVLEIGCGTGSTALVHAPYVEHIRATDISPNMIAIARSKAADAGITNVSFEAGAIDVIEAAEESYDVVLALSILHLVADRDAAIEKIFRWLKPGGVFVSSTACIADRMAWFKLIAPLGRALGYLPMVRIFSEKQLLASIAGKGFSIDHHWRPEKAMAVFVVAKKPG